MCLHVYLLIYTINETNFEDQKMKEMEKNSIPSEYYKHKPQSESENDTKFCKSLQDLNDLCSQLHFAADSYQSTFLNSNQKQL
ncbi:putative ABI family protein [Helianthus annuus]|nr:putative ABI family protein [Helianthus annuus]